MKNKVKYLNGSVQAAFYGLRFRSNRLKHSVKRFDRFGLATLVNCKSPFLLFHFIWNINQKKIFFSNFGKKLLTLSRNNQVILKTEFLQLEQFPVEHGLAKKAISSFLLQCRPWYNIYSYLHTSKKGAKLGFSLSIFLYYISSKPLLFIYQLQMSQIQISHCWKNCMWWKQNNCY